jgi:hypothetical protein
MRAGLRHLLGTQTNVVAEVDRLTLSAWMSHKFGAASPVSDSLMPILSLTLFWMSEISVSIFLS